MIALLSYSMSCLGNNHTLFYGAANDSLKISYDDLRIVNSKLVELDYEKQTNVKLKQVIENDKKIIATSDSINMYNNRRIVQLTRKNNIKNGALVTTVILLIISLFK